MRDNSPMRLDWALAPLLLCFMAIPLSCSKCAPTPSETASHDSSITSSQTVPADLRWDVLMGEEDAANRYPFTVIVVANTDREQERSRACSGVIIGPRLVLTAGSCVCVRSQPSPPDGRGTTLIDASTCETTASIRTFTYEPLPDDAGMESWSEQYQGTIRPHPQLEIRLDQHGNVVSSRANLAVIVLDRAVKQNTPAVPLAGDATMPNELLTVVGYGYIEGIAGLDGKRRFSEEKVSKAVDPRSDQVTFGQPELRSYKGDTGGPCLRETPRGPVLVGISNRGFSEQPTFTNVRVYEEWLGGELLHASQEGAVP